MKTYNLQTKLNEIQKIIDQGPYADEWQSLSSYEVPQWYQKLRFGIFIHYGLYTVPAFDSEWYPSADGSYSIKSFAKKQGKLNTRIMKIICPADGLELIFAHQEDELRIQFFI